MEVKSTLIFNEWIANLKDRQARARILTRIRRIGDGNFGVCRGVGEGISELKLAFGPGYRVYFVQRDKVLVLLLCGGDKSTQSADIERAKEMAKKFDSDEG